MRIPTLEPSGSAGRRLGKQPANLQICEDVQMFEEISWQLLQVVVRERPKRINRHRYMLIPDCPRLSGSSGYLQVSQGLEPSEGVL